MDRRVCIEPSLFEVESGCTVDSGGSDGITRASCTRGPGCTNAAAICTQRRRRPRSRVHRVVAVRTAVCRSKHAWRGGTFSRMNFAEYQSSAARPLGATGDHEQQLAIRRARIMTRERRGSAPRPSRRTCFMHAARCGALTKELGDCRGIHTERVATCWGCRRTTSAEREARSEEAVPAGIRPGAESESGGVAPRLPTYSHVQRLTFDVHTCGASVSGPCAGPWLPTARSVPRDRPWIVDPTVRARSSQLFSSQLPELTAHSCQLTATSSQLNGGWRTDRRRAFQARAESRSTGAGAGDARRPHVERHERR
jgi:hypothetical protein